MLVEFNPTFCQLLRERFPEATVIRGDAYRLRGALAALARSRPPRSCPVCRWSPSRCEPRLRLLPKRSACCSAGAPFIQFTYAVMAPIPKALAGIRAEASERIWLNVPPARVWVYRKG